MLNFVTPAPIPSQAVRSRTATSSVIRRTPCMGGWKKGEKDEAFRRQQEILARRRDQKRNKDYFEEVEKRRESVEEYFDSRTLKVKEGQDPLEPWKEMKDKGLIDEGGYSEMDEGGIPIPMASFGIPYYDRGGRFDLKLPHVEHGYTDPDADIMTKAGNAFKNLFGLGKNRENDAEEAKNDEPSP